MNTYEREYFVSRIRAGYHTIKDGKTKLKVFPPTICQEYDANEIYMESYKECLLDGFLTEEDLEDWMIKKGLWSEEKSEQLKKTEKDIDSLKVQIFENRSQEALREKARSLLRAAEMFLKELEKEKEQYQSNTCEGIAYNDKSISLFEWGCYCDDKPYDFPNDNVASLYFKWATKVLKQESIRELARTDPWRSHWALRDSAEIFANNDRELNIDQKNIIIWSQLYDNIQESMDCPSQDVIDDDDMLDGWMIVQKKKNESERANAEIESRITNPKISNAQEVYIFTDNKKDAEKINNMNSLSAQMLKKERIASITANGNMREQDFRDSKIKISNLANQRFKENFGGK